MASTMSKRPALRPGISDANSVSTPSISLMPIFCTTMRAITASAPVSTPFSSAYAYGTWFGKPTRT